LGEVLLCELLLEPFALGRQRFTSFRHLRLHRPELLLETRSLLRGEAWLLELLLERLALGRERRMPCTLLGCVCVRVRAYEHVRRASARRRGRVRGAGAPVIDVPMMFDVLP
jgi:hypothetical protein